MSTRVDHEKALTVRERVFAEVRRFRSMREALMPLYAQKWVVFRDGAVHAVFDTEEEAFVAGLDRFGGEGGHIVAQVREVKVVAMSGIASLGS